jgi:magnesium chelatase family protein
MLVAAMNPCLCGYHDHPLKKCTCSKRALWWHRRRLSGPILDRFDLMAKTETTEASEIFNSTASAESSADIRKRVVAARLKQQQRLVEHKGFHCNAQLSHDLIQAHCILDDHARKFLQRSWNRLDLSMRGLDKLLKVARTIADLDNSAFIELPHIAEAVHFKLFDLPTAVTNRTTKSNFPMNEDRQ